MSVKSKWLILQRVFVSRCGAVLLLLALMPSSWAADKKEDSLTGTWVGELAFEGQEFKLVYDLKQSPNGLVSGTLRVPQMSPAPMPIKAATLSGRNLSIEVEKVGIFRGKVSLKSGRISGDWVGEKGNKFSMDLKRSDEKWTYKRPQTPKAPFPYQVKEVQFANKLGDNRLAGTLTLPKSMRAVPAVILVSDTGPQDRDATFYDHKLFAVLADYLARKGIASLRYDDRGVGKSTGTHANGTTMDFATDAYAAVDFLKSQKEINSAAIGIIGYGEGGLIAPIVASKRDDLGFLVLLASPGVRGDQTLLIHSDAIGRASGVDEDFLKLSRRLLDSFYKLLTQTPPDMAKAAAIYAEFDKTVKALPPEKQVKLGFMGQFLGKQLMQIQDGQSPWLASFVAYDPGPTLEKVKCPVYALSGEKDLVVLPDIHLPAIKRNLSAGGNKKVKIEKLSD
ncbi:MAG: hypothetical protein GXP30_11410, partial [Verrucomicrobia bacterium]|nr:hypothetical protein [Verrucomicrobiota bacterium]